MAMFARITRTEARPEDIDGAQVKYDEETLFPTLRTVDGFKGAYVLVDRATGRGLTMTLWESEAAMGASEAAVAKMRDRAPARGFTIVGVERYEVAVVA